MFAFRNSWSSSFPSGRSASGLLLIDPPSFIRPLLYLDFTKLLVRDSSSIFHSPLTSTIPFLLVHHSSQGYIPSTCFSLHQHDHAQTPFRSFKLSSSSYSSFHKASSSNHTKRQFSSCPHFIDPPNEESNLGKDLLSTFLEFIKDESLQEYTLFDKFLLFSENFYHIVPFPIEVYDYLFSAFEKNDFHFCNGLYLHLLERLHRTNRAWSETLLETITLRFITSLSKYPQHNLFLKGVNHILQDFLLHFDFTSQRIWDSLMHTLVHMFANDLTNQRITTIYSMAFELLQVYKARFPEQSCSEQVFIWELRIHAFLQHADSVHAMYEMCCSETSFFSPSIYNTFIQAFSRIGEFDKATYLFQQGKAATPPIPITLESANSLLIYCAQQKDLVTCKTWLDTLIPLFDPQVFFAEGTKFNLYATFIECCREVLVYQRFSQLTLASYSLLTYRWKVAEQFMEAVLAINKLGIPIDQQCYESMLTCYVYANYDDYLKFPISKPLELLVEMKKKNIPLSPYAFQTVMRGFANTLEPMSAQERPKLIQKYMEIMRAADLVVDARTYSIYFFSYLHFAKEPPFSRSEHLFELKQKENEMSNLGIAHTHESMHALMRVYGALEAYEKMEELFQHMPSMGLPRNEETYFTIFHGATISESTAATALDFLMPMMEEDKIPISNVLMHTLFHCCAVSNNISLAWKLYEQLNTETLTPTSTILNYLLQLSIYNNSLNDIQFILDEFHRRRWFFTPATYYHLMNFYLRNNLSQENMKALFQRIQAQMKLVEEFYEKNPNQNIPSLLFSLKKAPLTSLVPFVSKISESKEPLQTISIPPLLPLPSYDSTPDQHPIPLLSDTRLYLRALEMFLFDQDLPNAINSFSNILIDFHLCLLHRYAIAQKYISDAHISGTVYVPGQQMLSYPPRIVEYSPMNTQVGSLYLPQDIAKATWLLCTAILSSPEESLPSTVPPVAYLYSQSISPESSSTTSTSFWQQHRCVYIPLAGKDRLHAARTVFQSSLRVLASYQDFSFILKQFRWVRDLMLRLDYCWDRSLEKQKLVLKEDISLASYTCRSLLTTIWDTPTFFYSSAEVWKNWLQQDQEHFQAVHMDELLHKAKSLCIPSPALHDYTSRFKVSPLMKFLSVAQRIKASPKLIDKMRVSSLLYEALRDKQSLKDPKKEDAKCEDNESSSISLRTGNQTILENALTKTSE